MPKVSRSTSEAFAVQLSPQFTPDASGGGMVNDILDGLGKQGGAASVLRRVRGDIPAASSDTSTRDVAQGTEHKIAKRLAAQLRDLRRILKARNRVDALRQRVGDAWRELELVGVPPLSDVVSTATAARVLVLAGVDAHSLAAALGISIGLARNYRSRATSQNDFEKVDLKRKGPSPGAEITRDQLIYALRALIERCKEAGAAWTALEAAETLIEAIWSATPAPATQIARRKPDSMSARPDTALPDLDELLAALERLGAVS